MEAKARVDRDGKEAAQDDDEKLLKDEKGIFAPLEVAHIIPHSLMSIGAGMQELVRYYIGQNTYIILRLISHLGRIKANRARDT